MFPSVDHRATRPRTRSVSRGGGTNIHGAGRFLILSRDGTPEPNRVWKTPYSCRRVRSSTSLLRGENGGYFARRHDRGRSFVRTISRRSLAVAVVLGVATCLAGAAVTRPATAAESDTTYLVLAPQGHSTAKAAVRVAAAGGTVVADYGQIGVLVVRSANPDFTNAAAGAGVEAVASTAGLGTPLEEDEIVEIAGPDCRKRRATRPASRCGGCSGICSRSASPKRTPSRPAARASSLECSTAASRARTPISPPRSTRPRASPASAAWWTRPRPRGTQPRPATARTSPARSPPRSTASASRVSRRA